MGKVETRIIEGKVNITRTGKLKIGVKIGTKTGTKIGGVKIIMLMNLTLMENGQKILSN